jgi:hypothetical protein
MHVPQTHRLHVEKMPVALLAALFSYDSFAPIRMIPTTNGVVCMKVWSLEILILDFGVGTARSLV